jgi:hypothetical protein
MLFLLKKLELQTEKAPISIKKVGIETRKTA